ncbi:hypothetical protein [Legionella tunisiensis]|uniref:hypothetical protein n=1 Tax=Legionella tunisiensis TaxID=1034944 RepID=UPI0002D42478|nr:hypothetical protein [Legionella tunisiensis]
MNRTELQAKVTSAIRAIELLENACADEGMKSWDKTAIHVEELSCIKAELQNKYSPLILELPPTKPDATSALSKDDRAALAAYNRYENKLQFMKHLLPERPHTIAISVRQDFLFLSWIEKLPQNSYIPQNTKRILNLLKLSILLSNIKRLMEILKICCNELPPM